ncbi:TetR/AcrR family transcriptional regulator [Mobiluncus mulieris]|uniref:Transcriptional regulator, TetR family n=2 Tax=Mobiluncus mulieris TaxID=2052 RepID=E0QMJ0_9ACTO|nr:TetR/AcrR family transcriptional regulator [Mobiluncus mulieris]EEJ53131.1 transcriptional regulator, TetR family [Mobiluncus mulieris ATCC 35243]EEZ92315.1 transcriptional regulator, TetR family [Mobiluncus mulieris 28-1]EFM47244.1 transcriptional regulator, TetR family [Mobiluncus mulieris ATCC 35239]EFN93684.1 transcriptional regulator, TetR family [Mobiluncus mulieris FB024-16]MBB5847382.1 AcrR family transcriptional regulator [Mobiluncus mulieris]
MPSSDRRTRGSYASGLARREAILDAAVDLLGEVGYHGMSLRDIARSVGISHPGVIYHFPSKEILLMSVVDRYEKEMGFDFRKLAQLDAMALLDTLLEVLSNVATNATIIEAECMLLAEASSELHPAHDHYEERNRKFRTLLTQAWTELQAQGLAHTALKARDIAVLQMSLFDGILSQWLYTHEKNCPGQMAQFYLSMFTPGATQESLGRYREAGWLR